MKQANGDETPVTVEAGLAQLIAERLGPDYAVCNIKRCSVGFSWLTFAFDVEPAPPDGGAFVLQVGPMNGLFAPYAATPQVRALQVLRDTAIPVAQTFWHSDGDEPFGGPFFVSRRVPGAAPLPWSIRSLPAGNARDLMHQFIEALARIHAAPHEGLADAGPPITPANAATLQVDHWAARITGWAQRRYPAMAWAERWLRQNAPPAPRIGIVHGDYRIGNFLAQDGRITAILDWEMVHPGDPHEDIGWACLPMFNGGSRELFGLMPRAEVYAAYEAVCGMKVQPASVHYYEAFSLYKGVAINIGAARCSEDGRHHDLRMAAMGTQISPMLRQLQRLIEAAP